MEHITLISILILLSSFIAGFLFQTVIMIIEKDNSPEKALGTQVIMWITKVNFFNVYLRMSSIWNNKNNLYLAEMRKELIYGKMDNSLFELLINEESIKKINFLVDTVVQMQEKNRRKNINDYNFLKKRFFIARQLFISSGEYKGIRVVEFLKMFIYYNKHLRGHFVPKIILEPSIQLFGNSSEISAIEFENKVLAERFNSFNKWVIYKAKENNFENLRRTRE